MLPIRGAWPLGPCRLRRFLLGVNSAVLDDAARILKLHLLFGSTPEAWIPQEWILQRDMCSWDDMTHAITYLRDRLGAPLESMEDDLEGTHWRYRPAESEDYYLPGMWRDVWRLYWGKVETQQAQRAAPNPAAEAAAESDRTKRFREVRGTVPGFGLHEQLGEDSTELRHLRYLRTIRDAGFTETDRQLYQTVGGALFRRQYLRFDDPATDGSAAKRRRVVAVQALSVHRGRWTLSLQEHGQAGAPLRELPIERVQSPFTIGETRVPDVDQATLMAHLEATCGAVPGPAGDRTGVLLRFTAYSARWGADEHWHPEQHQHFLADGQMVLRVPDTGREALLDASLRHVLDVDLVEPLVLRKVLNRRFNAAIRESAKNRKAIQVELQKLGLGIPSPQAQAKQSTVRKRSEKKR